MSTRINPSNRNIQQKKTHHHHLQSCICRLMDEWVEWIWFAGVGELGRVVEMANRENQARGEEEGTREGVTEGGGHKTTGAVCLLPRRRKLRVWIWIMELYGAVTHILGACRVGCETPLNHIRYTRLPDLSLSRCSVSAITPYPPSSPIKPATLLFSHLSLCLTSSPLVHHTRFFVLVSVVPFNQTQPDVAIWTQALGT